MNEEILRWLQSDDDSYINKIYKTIYPTILTMVRGNQLFRINRFSDEEAEEWADDILLRLNTVRRRIEERGFFAFARRVIRNYLINRINERRDEDGVIPVSIELPETLFAEADETDNDIINLEVNAKKIITERVETFYFKHLRASQENGTFVHLRKWSLWHKGNHTAKDTDAIIPRTDLTRIAFTTLEPSGYNIYFNPSSLLSKYDLWLNHNLSDRDYMWSAIDNMVLSKKEERIEPKPDPMVGAVLVDENGYVIASSFRGKNEPKGHCEYNLMEFEIEPQYVKRRYEIPFGLPGAGARVTELNLKNAVLYVTLEPCADRNNPKCSCADRVIYSGIKTVYIGLKDPDKTVDGNGIKKMEEAGITVKYFHQDLLFEIIRAKNKDGEQQNLEFIKSKKEFYIQEQPELFVNNVLLEL